MDNLYRPARRFCGACGQPVENDNCYCEYCGKRLPDSGIPDVSQQMYAPPVQQTYAQYVPQPIPVQQPSPYIPPEQPSPYIPPQEPVYAERYQQSPAPVPPAAPYEAQTSFEGPVQSAPVRRTQDGRLTKKSAGRLKKPLLILLLVTFAIDIPLPLIEVSCWYGYGFRFLRFFYAYVPTILKTAFIVTLILWLAAKPEKQKTYMLITLCTYVVMCVMIALPLVGGTEIFIGRNPMPPYCIVFLFPMLVWASEPAPTGKLQKAGCVLARIYLALMIAVCLLELYASAKFARYWGGFATLLITIPDLLTLVCPIVWLATNGKRTKQCMILTIILIAIAFQLDVFYEFWPLRNVLHLGLDFWATLYFLCEVLCIQATSAFYVISMIFCGRVLAEKKQLQYQ